MTLSAGLITVGVYLAGCGPVKTEPAPIIQNRVESTGDTDPAQHAADSLPPQNSVWSGEYTCSQGLTAIVLTIDHDETSHELRAEFAFSRHPQNAGHVPSGRYLVEGRYDPTTDRLSLNPKQWIDQPDGYVMVGLAGTYSAEDLSISGRVLSEGCTSWRASWQSGDIELR